MMNLAPLSKTTAQSFNQSLPWQYKIIHSFSPFLSKKTPQVRFEHGTVTPSTKHSKNIGLKTYLDIQEVQLAAQYHHAMYEVLCAHTVLALIC